MDQTDKIKNKKGNYVGIIVFVAIVFVLLFFNYYEKHKIEEYRRTFKGQTIGFTTRYKNHSKSISIKYYFYYRERIVGSMIVYGNNSNRLSKFYKVKYNLKNPYENYIVLDEELQPDSLELVKAGFTKVKYYIYDEGRTSEYIEKSKWK
ncbi:hypothetical protein [Flavobacterium flavipallidum]|uniref:DUF3592 domain-containing protein n=1 Tax=Flavobacterium flavipallidum TaxID=3139140 RepID=A0ABU9HLE1_9FLAO